MINKKSRIGCDRFDPVRKRLTIHQIASYYDVTMLDTSFQRKGGVFYGSGWSLPESDDYIDSFAEGSVENKITLCHVENSLEWAKKVGCDESKDYYRKAHEEGFEYVSIDGNNSSSTIFAFVRGVNLGSEKKPVYVKSSLLADEFPKSKGLFHLLATEYQMELFSGDKLDVVIYNKILLHEMTEKFRKINKQTSLNPQEYRQACSTPLTKQIQKWASDYERAFRNCLFSNPGDIDARKPDEEIARFVLKVQSNYTENLNKDNLDELYENNRSIDKEIIKTVDSVLEVFGAVTKEPLSKMLSKGKTANFFELIKIIHDSGYKVKNKVGLFEWFLALDAVFVTESKSVTEEMQKDESYTYWTGRYTAAPNYEHISNVFKLAFVKSEEDLIEAGIISKVRNSKEVFSHDQKLELLVKQDFQDRKSERLSALQLYTGELHADHVKSVKDGGETVISNGELMRAEDNLSKGSNSADPHFPFQIDGQGDLGL